MVTASRSQELHRFIVCYSEAAGLSRILDALFRAGAEPAWLFSRIRDGKSFRLDVNVASPPNMKIDVLAARLRAMPAVQSVKIKPAGSGEEAETVTKGFVGGKPSAMFQREAILEATS